MVKTSKILIIAIIMLMCSLIVANVAFAANPNPDTTWMNAEQFTYKNTTLDSSAQNIVGAIISVIRIVGTGISIIMLTAVAIKYMSSAPGDRADIKKHAVVYVVGAVVLFGATQLIGIIQNFATNIK